MQIVVKDVNYVYSAKTPFERHALKGVNLTINEGDFLGIIGHTGSGKSTFIMHLNGLFKLQSGEIDVFDIKLVPDKKNKSDLRRLRGTVGMVFQYPEYQLFEETVSADIAFGPKNMGLSEEECRVRVQKAAAFCGIDDKTLARSPFEISGGQKRRAAIAGVVAMDPDVLVLDEPAAGLDPRGREEILGGLMEYQRERQSTMLVISHSMEDIAKYADFILVLKEGEVFMFGTVGEIFSDAQKLFGSSLDLPQITKLFVELKKRGITDRTDIYTVGYAEKILSGVLEERAERH